MAWNINFLVFECSNRLTILRSWLVEEGPTTLVEMNG